MADFPLAEHLTSPTTTELQFQTALGDLIAALNQLAVQGPPESLEISSGLVTPTKAYLMLDTEGQTASDQLNQIMPTNLGQKLLVVRSLTSSRVVTLTHKAGGTGALNLAAGSGLTLESNRQVIVFTYNSDTSEWDELWRNWGVFVPTTTAAELARAALGLTTAAQTTIGTGVNQIPLNGLLGALAFRATISQSQLEANAVGTTQLANNAVTRDKLSPDANNKGKFLGYDATNGAVVPMSFSEQKVSGATGISGGVAEAAHALGSAPTRLDAYLFCVTTDGIFGGGTAIYLSTHATNINENAALVYATATTVGLRIHNGIYRVLTPNNQMQDLNLSKWQFRFTAFK